MTDLKRCRDCEQDKPLSEFHRDSRKSDGRRVNCKQCRSSYMNDRYAADREAILERQRANPRDSKALDAYQRQYRDRNRDALKVKNRGWRLENADLIQRRNREYYASNKERISAVARQWRARSHERILCANREREALKNSVTVDHGITKSKLRERDGSQCSYCGIELQFVRSRAYLPDKASIDHVVPLVKGGSHTWGNVVLACLRCNISKRDKDLDEWQEALRQH